MPHAIIASRGDQLTRGMARTTQVLRALFGGLAFCIHAAGKATKTHKHKEGLKLANARDG